MDYRERIRSRREELGMTQEELAKKTGYKTAITIERIENGTLRPQYKKNLLLARALGMSVKELFGYSDNSNILLKEAGDDIRKLDEDEVECVIRFIRTLSEKRKNSAATFYERLKDVDLLALIKGKAEKNPEFRRDLIHLIDDEFAISSEGIKKSIAATKERIEEIDRSEKEEKRETEEEEKREGKEPFKIGSEKAIAYYKAYLEDEEPEPEKKSAKELTIYTGASKLDNKPYHYFFRVLADEKSMAEGASNSIYKNSSEAEAQALCICLSYIREHFESVKLVTVYTKDDYIAKGINKWIRVWERNGWRKKNGEVIKNLKTWELVSAMRDSSIVRAEMLKEEI